jgi:hypothetical protein
VGKFSVKYTVLEMSQLKAIGHWPPMRITLYMCRVPGLRILSLGLSYTVLVKSLLNEANHNGNMKDLEVIYKKEGGKKKPWKLRVAEDKGITRIRAQYSGNS